MRVRILASLILAVACAGGVLFFLWWQLQQSSLTVPNTVKTITEIPDDVRDFIQTDVDIDPRDKALFHVRQGDVAALQGDWARAQVEYSAAVDADGGLSALRKLARAQLMRRDMNGVSKTLHAMKKRGARSQDILLLEVRILLSERQVNDAKALLLSAEDSPQQHYGLVLVSVLEGDHEAAKSYLDQVVKGWDPQLRSYARSLQAAYDEFALFPESSDVHLVALLSRALAEIQECEVALPLLSQVTSLQQDYRDAWVVQGYCELVTERTAPSIASLQQAYALDPQKPEIQYFLGRAYKASGDHTNALTFLQYALLNGFSAETEVRLLIAESAMKTDNFTAALDQYMTLLALEEPNIALYEGIVNVHIGLEQFDKAFSYAKEAVDTFPQEGRAYQLLGQVELELGRPEEAKIALKKALELDPYLQEADGLLRGL